jgi:hypothetical protein
MKEEDFKKEVQTLVKMFPVYCRDKHKGQQKRFYSLKYGTLEINFEIELCPQCHELFAYALERLKECPHDPKPRCRKCPDPCYVREKYKQMTRIMSYAGIKLGLSKAARKIKNFFKRGR